jgi:hypothetical protein
MLSADYTPAYLWCQRDVFWLCTVSENSIINLLPSQEDYLLNKIFPREYTLGRENLLQVEEEAKKFCSNFRYSSFLFGVSVPNPFSVRLLDPDQYPEGKTCTRYLTKFITGILFVFFSDKRFTITMIYFLIKATIIFFLEEPESKSALDPHPDPYWIRIRIRAHILSRIWIK